MKKLSFILASALLLAMTCMLCALLFVACNPRTEVANPGKVISKPDSVLVYRINEDETEMLSQITYLSYDVKGHKTCEETISAINAKIITKLEWRYDINGNMVEYILYYYNSCDGYYVARRDVYTYTFNNKPFTWDIYIPMEYSDHAFKKGVFTWIDDTHAECQIYGYNRYFPASENEWVPKEKYIYSYNAYGDVLETIMLVQNAIDSWKAYDSVEKIYDEYGNLVSSVHKDTKGYGLDEDFYKYEYDESGRIQVQWLSQRTSEDKPFKLVNKSVYYY